MNIIQILLLSIPTLGILFCIYMLYRNNKVYRLRHWFIENEWEKFSKLPEYEQMFYSFKPLTTKYWLKYCEDK